MSRPPYHPGSGGSNPAAFTAPLPTARRQSVQLPTVQSLAAASSPPAAAVGTAGSASAPAFLSFAPSALSSAAGSPALSPPLPFFSNPPLPRSPQSYAASSLNAAATPLQPASQLPSGLSASSSYALSGHAASLLQSGQQQQQLYLAQSMQPSLSLSSFSSDAYHSTGGATSTTSLLSAQPAFVAQSLSHAGLPLSMSSSSAAAALSLMSAAGAGGAAQLPAQPFSIRSQSSPTYPSGSPSVPIYVTPLHQQYQQLQHQQQHKHHQHAFNPAMQHYQHQQQHYQPQQHQQQHQPPPQHPSVINVLYSSSVPTSTAGPSSHFLQPSPAARLGSYGSVPSLQSAELSVVSPAPSSESLLSLPNASAGLDRNTSPSASDQTVSQIGFQRTSPSASPPPELSRLGQHTLPTSSSTLSSSSSSHVLQHTMQQAGSAGMAAPDALTSAMASQLISTGALSAVYVESSQRLLMEHDYINAYLHALLASHQSGISQVVHERADLLKRLAFDKLKQASATLPPYSTSAAGALGSAPLISPHLQAVLTQYALTLPHTNAGFFSELAAISSPAAASGALSTLLLPPQPLGARSFSAPSPAQSPSTPHHPAASFFAQSALSTASASPSSSPSSSTSSSPSLLERTAVRSASTTCKYCGRTWVLSSLSSPSSREKRNKQLKAKRDHQPFCIANPARVINLDKRRKKKKRREDRERRSKGKGRGDGEVAGVGAVGGVGGGGGGEGEDGDGEDDDSEGGSEMDDEGNEGVDDVEEAEAAAGGKRQRRDSSNEDPKSSQADTPAAAASIAL